MRLLFVVGLIASLAAGVVPPPTVTGFSPSPLRSLAERVADLFPQPQSALAAPALQTTTPTITKSVDVAQADPGDTLYYTVTVDYPGDDLLTDVTVTDAVPAGTSFLAAEQTGTESGGTVTWNLGGNDAASNGSTLETTTTVGSFGTATEADTAPGDSNDGKPEITVDDNGDLHAVFINNNERTYYMTSTDDGATWSTPSVLPAFNSKNRNADIAVDSSGNIHVVIDDENKRIWYARSTDGGASWPTTFRENIGTSSGNDELPRIVVDSNDDLHVVFVDGDSTFYQTSTNAGVDWLTNPVELPQINGEDNDSSADIAVDSNGGLHVVIDNENKNVFYTSSTTGGLTTGAWSAGVEIDTTSGDGSDELPRIVVDRDNDLHVVFVDGDSTFYQTSTNAGSTWLSPPVELPQINGEDNDRTADITVDACGGLHVVVDNENKNVFYTNSFTGGLSTGAWSAGVEIDTATGDEEDRFPVIAVTSDTVNVLFADNAKSVYQN